MKFIYRFLIAIGLVGLMALIVNNIEFESARELKKLRLEYSVVTVPDSINTIIDGVHTQIMNLPTADIDAFFWVGNIKTAIFTEHQEDYPFIQEVLEDGDSLVKKANSRLVYLYKQGKIDELYIYQIKRETPSGFVKD